MNKKFFTILILAVVAIVVLIFFTKLNNRKNTNENAKITKKTALIEKIDIPLDIEKYKSSLSKSFKELEEKYKDIEGQFFYNSEFLKEVNKDYIDIVNLDDIKFDSEKYNSKLEKVEELPKLKYNNKEIEISSKYKIEDNKYYLIRYKTDETKEYTLYFIGNLNENGFNGFELYCVTEGEHFESI